MNLAWLGAGAALGGAVRFAVEYVLPPVGTRAFPRATLAVNLAGSFIIGLVQPLDDHVRTVLAVGVCGALTTFSGVSLQAHRRVVAGAAGQALGYLAVSLVGCCALAWLGLAAGSALLG